MKPIIGLFALLALALTGCGESRDVVSNATLLQSVQVTKVDTESCGDSCTEYMITILDRGNKQKYESNEELYNAIKQYRAELKAQTGSNEATYNVIVLPEKKDILAISPTKNSKTTSSP